MNTVKVYPISLNGALPKTGMATKLLRPRFNLARDLSLARAHSLWAGLCPEKLAKLNKAVFHVDLDVFNVLKNKREIFWYSRRRSRVYRLTIKNYR